MSLTKTRSSPISQHNDKVKKKYRIRANSHDIKNRADNIAASVEIKNGVKSKRHYFFGKKRGNIQ